MKRIYLDNNASTPPAQSVIKKMAEFRENHYGNPSGENWATQGAKVAIEKAREQVAELINAEPGEIVFTSSGSESNNLITKGIFFSHPKPVHFITSTIEHPSVLEPLHYLETIGGELTVLPVSKNGRVDPADLPKALKPNTRLVTIMTANNETGVIQPIEEIVGAVKGTGTLVHTDAAQAVGKIPVDVSKLGVDALTIVGHKMYGPKGVSALYLKKREKITPLIHGGGHEGGLRASTHATELIVGLGEACRLAKKWVEEDKVKKIADLRDKLFSEIRQSFSGPVTDNSANTERLPNTLNISFPGLDGREILKGAPEIAASTGSSCHSESEEPSGVLASMGLPAEISKGALRLSVGRNTTESDVIEAARQITKSAERNLREIAR